MSPETKAATFDHGSTAIGAGFGIEQLYEAVQGLLTDGATGSEWAALFRGLLLMVFGFMAWKRTH